MRTGVAHKDKLAEGTVCAVPSIGRGIVTLKTRSRIRASNVFLAESHGLYSRGTCSKWGPPPQTVPSVNANTAGKNTVLGTVGRINAH